jgi:hypothetical protein
MKRNLPEGRVFGRSVELIGEECDAAPWAGADPGDVEAVAAEATVALMRRDL